MVLFTISMQEGSAFESRNLAPKVLTNLANYINRSNPDYSFSFATNDQPNGFSLLRMYDQHEKYMAMMMEFVDHGI